MYHKENGGKHTALNFGISKITTDMVGCLDADSYVNKDMLRNIVTYFADKEVMAVTPSVKVWKPKTIIQLMQKVEYGWGIFIRKMLSYIDALYVTPGPGTIFRKEVFENLGGYRHAHLTEDMEIALRMQSNQYKIANSHDAYVYTVAPDTVYKLYKQKLRWTYGFIKNVIDYRFMFFKKQYGNLGVFILPIATFSILSGIYVGLSTLSSIIASLFREFTKIRTVGINFNWDGFSFDLFSINTEYIAILSVIALLGMVTIIVVSRRMAEGKMSLGMDLIYFMTLYTFIAPVWMARALYNALFSVKTNWR
jgi:cellulose synthase/poly-beta-1,6-N-acetylglucosamine synthase-like glycosyltransferase